MTQRFAGAIALATAAWLGISTARAETPGGGIALDQLDPAPAGDAFFGVPSPSVGGHLVPRAFLMFDYAARPLSLSTGGASRAIVSGQGFLHLNASFAVFDRLLVSALLPIAVVQSGESPTVDGIAFTSPTSAQVGDLRLGARVRVFGEDGTPFQASVGAQLHVPTGSAGGYTGDGAVRVAPQLAVGGRVSLLQWTASLGTMIRGSGNPSMLTYGAGVSVSLLGDKLQVGPEVFAATPLQQGYIEFSNNRSIVWGGGSNAELLIGARLRLFRSLVVGAAAGPGLSSAIGTPVFRAVGMIGWSPLASAGGAEEEQKRGDSDDDGVLDGEDGCPYAFGVKSADPKQNGCPMADGDEDGVGDAEDACPEERGGEGGDPGRRGCPADGDGDGVADVIDACPEQKGSAEGHGCPAAAGKR